MRKSRGFTLAEVLITLSIIGIVAAMTVPNLMQNWRKQERISQLQVAYSILQNATKMAVAEHGDASSWDYNQQQNEDNNLGQYRKDASKAYAEKYFIPYVKTKDKGTFYSDLSDSHGYAISSSSLIIEGYSVILDNGMLVHTKVTPDGSIRFLVDTNSFSKPNRNGNDVFWFTTDFSNNSVQPLQPTGTNNCTQNYMQTNKYAGNHCAYNIIHNGWKIPDDYPIKKF